jgi:hypothetical protein
MISTIEFLFVAAGLFCLVWAITTSHGSRAAKVGAGGFGLFALLVGLFLGAGERRDDWRRDW